MNYLKLFLFKINIEAKTIIFLQQFQYFIKVIITATTTILPYLCTQQLIKTVPLGLISQFSKMYVPHEANDFH